MCLVPLETLINRFQRLTRDLSLALGKKVHFHIQGGDVELDKTILQNLSAPLLHLFRNCVDHGIETPEERLAAGKAEFGNIWVRALTTGGSVQLTIEDDGRGIDLAKVRQKALTLGLIDENQKLSDEDLIELIFSPGFSTAAAVTDVSGRGVGMDVVRRTISDLRGQLAVQTRAGKGTTFVLQLPHTLSLGLLVSVQETQFFIPLPNVERCFIVPTEKLLLATNNMIDLEGETVPVHWFSSAFGLQGGSSSTASDVVLLRNGEAKMALVVDYVVGQYQAILQPIPKQLAHIELISGATVLGNGSVGLALDVYQLFESQKSI